MARKRNLHKGDPDYAKHDDWLHRNRVREWIKGLRKGDASEESQQAKRDRFRGSLASDGIGKVSPIVHPALSEERHEHA